MEKYIRKFYKDIFVDNVLIIGCKRNRVDLSIITDKGTLFYDYFLVKESLDKDYLNSLISTFLMEQCMELPAFMVLYGDENIIPVYKSISSFFKPSKIIIPNIFTDTKSNAEKTGDFDYETEGYKFVPSFGSAI